MPDLPTRLDYFALGRDYVLQRAKKIDPAQVDIEGSDVNIIVGVSSVMADHVTKQLAFRTASLLLDGCDDEDLDRYVFDRYQQTRKGASPAVGAVRIFRTDSVAGGGTIPIGTKLTTTTGVQYITTTAATLGSTDLVTRADVRAVEAGKVTQAGANSIQRFAVPSALFDRNLQVNNDNTTAGGEDAEDDETFRARVRDFWRVARRGILAAIESGALTVPGVVSAQAIEVLTTGNQPARLVQLYIADSSGVASDALARLVLVALDEFRAGGIQVLISTSIPLLVDVQLQLTFRANVDTLSLTDQVRAAFVGFINSLPVNGVLLRADLNAVLSRYKEDGLVPVDTSIIAPVGDLVPPTGTTIRTTLANVTVAT